MLQLRPLVKFFPEPVLLAKLYADDILLFISMILTILCIKVKKRQFEQLNVIV